MNKPLTINLLVERDSVTEPFDCFTEKELNAMSGRLSRAMSKFYTAHKDELIN